MAPLNFCPSCGSAPQPGDRFCDSCGHNLAAAVAAAEGHYSPDGKWLWDGLTWIPVQEQPAPVAAQPTPAVKAKPKKAPSKVWYPLGVILIVVILAQVFYRLLPWYAVEFIAGLGLALAIATWRNPRGIGATITKAGSKLRLPWIRPGAIGRKAGALIALDLALLPAWIGGWATYAQVFAPTGLRLSGYAVMANPLTSAKVDVYLMTNKGRAGSLLGTATTDKNGHYSISLAQPRGSRLLVTTSGGSYVDQVTNKPVIAAPGDSLRSVMLSYSGFVSLTPLSTFATSRATTLAASGQPLDASIGASFSGVAQDYGLPDVSSTYPSDAVIAPEQQAGISTLPSRQMGLALSGLDSEANALGTSDFALINAMASDISDGNFDGKKGLDAIPMNLTPAVMLPADAATKAAKKAHDNPGDKMKNILAPDFFSGPIATGINTGGLYWVATPQLPAWRSGEYATTAVEGAGGTKPYRCELVGGNLPPGFSLSETCQISGRAEVTTDTIIGGAFSVKMTDSSNPTRSVTAELHITIVPKPPAVQVHGGQCPGPNQPCRINGFATATGGTAPYYFTHGDLSDPPLGMILWPDGSLRGTPHKAGPFTFQVCVVDLGGSMGCTDGMFEILSPAPSPAPKNRLQSLNGTWVSGPIDFTRSLGCSVETDRYTSSTWVIDSHPNVFSPVAANQVGISVTLTGGEIVSQSNPGCINFNVYLNNPLSVYLGTVNGSTMALADADNPPNPQGSCTLGADAITCTIDDGHQGHFDYATAPNGINLTRQK